ncbi:MAG: DUF1565 domain-containing protein [Bdellovibrio sp.]|nr:DUF1565 domain-containing protein [Bdellovibrio sp.]
MNFNQKILITILSSISINSFASELYLSVQNGKDSNTGTASAPFRTIQMAAVLAQPGTTVQLASGTYTENLKTTVSGTSSARIHYVSDSKGGAKIIGTGTEVAWLNNGSYVDIDGFDVSGSGRLGIQNEASFVVIKNNHVHDIQVSGGCNGSGGAGIVNSNYSAPDNDIIGNVVHNIGTPGACNGVQGIW